MIGYPTFRDVRDLAHKLWEEKGSPSASQVPPEHFWYEAERKITSTIVLAISEEVRKFGVIRKPGDSFYSDHYYRANETVTYGHPPRLCPCAYGNLNDSGEYIIRHRLAGRAKTFDLNCETNLNELLEYLKLAVM